MSQNPTQRYLEVQVSTSSKEDLLLLLLDGGVRFTEQALLEMDKGDEGDAGFRNEKLVRAQKILLELMGALSPAIGLELFNNLQGLYQFTFQRLFEGNVQGDRTMIEEGLEVMKRIRDMWKEAVAKAKEERGPSKPQTGSTLSVQG